MHLRVFNKSYRRIKCMAHSKISQKHNTHSSLYNTDQSLVYSLVMVAKGFKCPSFPHSVMKRRRSGLIKTLVSAVHSTFPWHLKHFKRALNIQHSSPFKSRSLWQISSYDCHTFLFYTLIDFGRNDGTEVTRQ